MANKDIRAAAKGAGVMLWEVAEALGVADSTLSRQLRHELSQEKKAQALNAIQQIAAERKEAN